MNRGSKRFLAGLGMCALLFATTAAQAALTPVLPAPAGEPDLAAPGGILDQYFGLDNLTRIDDDLDRYWRNDGVVKVRLIGKWAGFDQSFGFFNAEDEFKKVFKVPSPYSKGNFSSEQSGTRFRFGLQPSGAPLWSSVPEENRDLLDHMVTWQITGGKNPDMIGHFVIAWEDFKKGGDRDFNDLVVLVKGDIALAAVPLPPALWLFGAGLVAMAGVARRRADHR